MRRRAVAAEGGAVAAMMDRALEIFQLCKKNRAGDLFERNIIKNIGLGSQRCS